MTRKLIALPGLAALLLSGCGGPNRNDAAPAAGTGAETGAVPVTERARSASIAPTPTRIIEIEVWNGSSFSRSAT